MHAHTRSWRAYLPLFIAAALAVCLAPAAASAAPVSGGIFTQQPALSDAFITTVTVTFDSNGGSAVDTQLVESGSLVATPVPDPVRTGYTFAGWYADAGLTTPWDFATNTVGPADATLYASWAISSYQVAFNSNGGSPVDTQTIAFGSLVATPVPDPTRTGYTFAGWYANALLTTPWNFATDTVGAVDMTLYAKWTVNSYHVTFDSNGGSAVTAQSVAFGAHVTKPAPDPTKAGYTFAGWYFDAALTTPWNFATDAVGSADMTLYAKWTVNNYHVSFNSNGGSAVGVQSVAFGAHVAAPNPDPTHAGFTFAGWYANASLTTPWNFATDTVGAADMTLYAKWTVNNYRVAFDSGGGSAVNTQSVAFDTRVTKPVPDPTKAGYTFAGWYFDAGLTIPWTFAVDTVGAGDMTLYAKWTVNSYHVAFDSGGGSAVTSQSVAFGAHITKPADPTLAGHTFAGWFSDAALTIPWNFATDTVGAADMTLHAKWSGNGYQVAFVTNGGSAVTSQSVAFGSLVATPVPAPTKIGYAFAGWYSDAALTTPWDFTTNRIGSGDMTLYAKWTGNGYQVAFVTNGGSAVPTQSVAFGAHVATPTPAPTRTGYAFIGWFADAALTTAWDFSAGTVGASDMTLYAKWVATYKIAGSAGSHGSLSIGSGATVRRGTSLTVTVKSAKGYGVAAVKVDGVAKGRVTSYKFINVTKSHTISATFKRVTSTTLTASAKSVSKNQYITLHASLKSTASSYGNMYIRFEVKLPGTSTYILLKTVKLSSSGKASYRYQVLNKGTRYHRVRFLETTSFLSAPVKTGLALRVK